MKQLNEYCIQVSSINEYLSTKVKVNKNILDDIDYKKFKWKESYSSNTYISSCKDTINNFLNSKYGDYLYPNIKTISDRLIQLYRDTYRAYLSTETNMNDKALDTRYDNQMKRLDRIMKETGWSQYEYGELEQGWWAFINFIICEKYINL